jgi:nitrous oxidase accessory protein NosD
MNRRNSVGRSFTGTCGALTWLLLSACGPATLTESRFTESLFSQGEQPHQGDSPVSEGPDQDSSDPSALPGLGELPDVEAPRGQTTEPDNETQSPTGRSWYVSMRGSDVGSGTLEAPLRTIARAAALARPGDVVRVLPGTYQEQLVLESRGAGAEAITLRGEGSVRPTLQPRNRAPGSVIFVRGRWNLENLHVDVDGAPQAAVVFHTGADESRLTESELRDGRAGGGVIVQGARHVRILNNLIHHFIKPLDDSHGIVVVGPSQDVIIRGNNIHNNSGDSIQCQGGTGPAQLLLVETNLLHDDGENGVDIKECNDVVIRNNDLSGFPNPVVRLPGSSAGEAVLVSRGARGVVIQGNTIARAGRGVSILAQVAPPEDIRIERNTIRNIRNFPAHNGQGIRISGGRNVQVLENTVENTASYGLMLAADGMVVPDITVRDNRVTGGTLKLLVRLGRQSFRPRFSMGVNHYGRGGALSEDGVREKLHGPLERYRGVFIGENIFLSTPDRIDVWRQVSEVDQGSGLQ